MADPVEALNGLRPIHLPADSGEVFLIAAAMLAGIVAALAGVALIRLLSVRRGAERRAALAELALSRGLAPDERLAAQAKLLRRLVRTIDGEAPRGLGGDAWLTRLDQTLRTSFFTAGAGQAFGEPLYRRSSAATVETLDLELSRLIAMLPPRISH
ncbi:DUF4381 domain-containing protein [Methylocella silvestris]|uniref:DUF4381 domain-containing protein n=1 Tax=Methylocella silvestris TaxID=199596 RepID=A0A2J7THE1_METSI|nr:DUF4381 domain-containing protein [Methylocella silvestris]PNG26183.1 hypothetical protein CR492_10100 [Methylocella silvestris]